MSLWLFLWTGYHKISRKYNFNFEEYNPNGDVGICSNIMLKTLECSVPMSKTRILT